VASAAPGPDVPTVFLHSSFRTSSTWLWGKFRADPMRMCFYEVFQERLADLTLSACLTVGPDSWQSGHPPGPPYLLEFIPLLRPDGGVNGYNESMAFETMIPEGGLNGELTPEERSYLGSMIDLARVLRKQPVLSCTRSLGRAAALKRTFGGVHVLLWRNLHHQWLSYAHQQEIGNPYFMHSLCWSLTARRLTDDQGCDPILRLLMLYMVSHCGNKTADWIPPEDSDHAYIAFTALHLHLTMAAFKAADVLVDVNRLTSGDQTHRRDVETRVAALTGHPLHLNDAQETIQRPSLRLKNPDYVWEQIELMFTAIKAASNPDTETLDFGQRLLDQAKAACLAEV
jgi:hypothetical protein